MPTENALDWKDEYSVGVAEIDDQHKKLFAIINDLVDTLRKIPQKDDLETVLTELVTYKSNHFETEERYFHQFGYVDTKQHEEAHRSFNSKIAELQKEFGSDVIGLSFALADFLENWLIDHLLNMDKKYKQCFQEHGLS